MDSLHYIHSRSGGCGSGILQLEPSQVCLQRKGARSVAALGRARRAGGSSRYHSSCLLFPQPRTVSLTRRMCGTQRPSSRLLPPPPLPLLPLLPGRAAGPRLLSITMLPPLLLLLALHGRKPTSVTEAAGIRSSSGGLAADQERAHTGAGVHQRCATQPGCSASSLLTVGCGDVAAHGGQRLQQAAQEALRACER